LPPASWLPRRSGRVRHDAAAPTRPDGCRDSEAFAAETNPAD
jgi:hypothetical protein